MRGIPRRFIPVSILILSAGGLCAQSPAAARLQDCNCGDHVAQPYTAEFKISRVQMLANGTTITNESTEIQALDSTGRRLRSTTSQFGPNHETRTSVYVNDTAGRTEANWDSLMKKAHVTKLPPQDQHQGCWSNDAGNIQMSWGEGARPGSAGTSFAIERGMGTGVGMIAGGSSMGSVVSPTSIPMPPGHSGRPATEDLGTTTIQGVEAHGDRITRTIPAGQIGNDAPIVSTNELWTSRQLGLILREVIDDPRMGKTTRELVNLTLGEPDPALFQPPDGYEVKTEELHQVPCNQ